MARCGEPATVRRGGAGAAQQASDGAAGDATTGDDISILASMGVNNERRGYGVNIHVDRLNEVIGDGDGIFAWKELVMGHWFHFSLVPTDMGVFGSKG